ncbi:NAD(P)H-dependent glycerol-3-phosphate dehydrogenase [soil metagenome]
MRIAVIGSGSWGTALAILLGRNGQDVLLLGRDEHELWAMRETRENPRYLPGFALPSTVQVEQIDFSAVVDLAIVAVPAGSFREVIAASSIKSPITAIASKGLDPFTGGLLTETVMDSIPAVFSGPNLAVEIARGIPAVAVAASADLEAARLIQDAFSCATFRVSLSQDVIGVELAGALKNVLAIGGGMSDGLGFGDNTKGALLSRGLMEMSRLGVAMGADLMTFLGPAGVGDLFATAASKLSRNYRVGRMLGEGMGLADALASLGQVAEGVPTAHACLSLARKFETDMPVFAAIDAVIQGRVDPRTGVSLLMERGSSMRAFV